MQLGAEAVFVGSGIFKSSEPAVRAKAIVEAVTHYDDPQIVAKVSRGLGEAMVGIEVEALETRLSDRGLVAVSASPVVGVLGLQGAADEHRRILRSLHVDVADVRRPDHLDAVDALVIPGGESTTISMLLERAELFEPIAERLDAGMPALGTCAGLILLAAAVSDGRTDQRCFAAIDVAVRRNGYGRQVDSFEADLDVPTLPGDPVRAVFIRAPVIESVGPGVETLACVDRVGHGPHPVLCRSGPVLVSSFHPELTDDRRIHELWLAAFAH